MLSHTAGNKVTGLVLTLENLIRDTAPTQPKLSERLGKAHTSAKRFRAFLNDFISDPRNAATPGPQSIRKLVEEARDLTRDLQNTVIGVHGIDIQVQPGDDYTVYCSKLFRQHLCNVLDNSLYWIVKRRSAEAGHRGLVAISIGPAPQDVGEPDSALNQRCLVSIRDNGMGVSADVLKELRAFPLNFTTRAQEGGTGYGLWALRQYAEGIGGWVEIASDPGDYFEVSILLDVFNDLVHRQPKKWGSGW
jgi:signal transduction histidine kinase